MNDYARGTRIIIEIPSREGPLGLVGRMLKARVPVFRREGVVEITGLIPDHTPGGIIFKREEDGRELRATLGVTDRRDKDFNFRYAAQILASSGLEEIAHQLARDILKNLGFTGVYKPGREYYSL